ncbi:MAG: HAMP domain-containing histidine kinase [Clostridia bacterium]|nr:HAMP domain-containing histidine kinase [Clostridia bacterium]
MEIFLILLSLAIAIALIILTAKILIMKKAAKEIKEQFSKLIQGNTNALINISCADKDISALACSLNAKISELREKELTYVNGDKELKSAITNVAHDIRTPLTAICGYTDMIKEETSRDKIDKYLAIISERANALKTLSEELFKYSVATNTTSEKNQQFEKLDVNCLLQETLFSFYTKFCQRDIIPKITACESAVLRITDKNSLTRIFSNIIENAIKYSDGDFSVNVKEDGTISFSNTARNLNNVDVGKLFDRFFTVENGKYSTGLGLSIAKQLTKQLGGEITAEYSNEVLTIIFKI